MDFTEISEKEIVEIATPIIDNLMGAAANFEYKSHIKDLHLPVPEGFTKEKFQQDCKKHQAQFGIFTCRETMGVAASTDFVNIYWKQNYSKTPIKHLAVLTLSSQNNKYIVHRMFLAAWQLQC